MDNNNNYINGYVLLIGSYAVHGVVKSYLKTNCDKLKMYTVISIVTTTNR